MDLQIDPALCAFRRDVRAFLHEQLTGDLRRGQYRVASVFAEPETSGPWQSALQRRGWLVPQWPSEWGGTGWTPLQRFVFETECALAGAPLVHPMGVRLVGPVLLKFGTEVQKRAYLPRILSGEDYWCQGFSEPGAGSDLASLKLRADVDGDHYVLNGSKIWTTHAQHANRMAALVRTSTLGKRQDGISFLLIDMASPGITVRPIRTIGGDNDLNEVFFDAVRVPRGNLVGEENCGWDCARYLLEFERGSGIFSPRLRSQLKRVWDALRELQAQGLPLSPELPGRFGEVAADIDAFEMLELKSLGVLALGQAPGPISSVLKLRASRMKQAVAELGVDVLGPESRRWQTGTPRAEDDERAAPVLLQDFLNSRAFTIFGGAAEVQLGIIARTLVGI